MVSYLDTFFVSSVVPAMLTTSNFFPCVLRPPGSNSSSDLLTGPFKADVDEDDDYDDDADESNHHNDGQSRQLLGRPLSMKAIARLGWGGPSSSSPMPSRHNASGHHQQPPRRLYSAQTAIRGGRYGVAAASGGYHRHAMRQEMQAAATSRNHYLQFHKGKLSKKIVCGCGRTFSYVGGYTYHLRWECGKVLTCQNCAKVFKDKAYLTKHSRTCGIEPQVPSWEMHWWASTTTEQLKNRARVLLAVELRHAVIYVDILG